MTVTVACWTCHRAIRWTRGYRAWLCHVCVARENGAKL